MENASSQGYPYAQLQWAYLPCKDAPKEEESPLCAGWNTPQGNYGAGGPGTDSLGCGARGSNPYIANCGNQKSSNTDLGGYGHVPGQPLGTIIGSPFQSTECQPEIVTPPTVFAPLMKPCGDNGCQALYESRVNCGRRVGEVRRYWQSTECLCRSEDGENYGDCAGSGTNKGCVCSPAGCPGPRLPNYRHMLKPSTYPFC